MKTIKITDRKIPKEYEFQKRPAQRSNQDLKYSSSSSSFYVSKIMNQNKIKNQSLINESLPNLKKNIQKIFSNEDEKEKIFQFLIKKNRDKSTNESKDVKKVLETSENKPFKHFDPKKVKSPDYNEHYTSNPIQSRNKDSARSCIHIGNINNTKDTYTKNTYKYSGVSGLYPEDKPLNQNEIYKGNNFYHNTNNNICTNLITNNSNNSILERNKRRNKVEHIAIYNTFNNTFNNFRIPKNKDDKNISDKSMDNNNNYYCYRNSSNKTENNNLENNPYKDYMRNTNTFGINKKILENSNKKNQNQIDINYYSENKQKDDNNNNIKKNYYFKRTKNDLFKAQKTDNFPTQKTSIINNNKNYYYIHKKPKYKKILFRKNIITDDSNVEINNINEKNGDNQVYEKKNYYDIYGNRDRDIRTYTLENIQKSPTHINNNEKMNKTIDNDVDNKSIKLKTIKINIDKNTNKKISNSPISFRFNKYYMKNTFNNNNNNNSNYANMNNYYNSRSNKRIYEKRDTFHRSPRQSIINKYLDNNTKDINIPNNDKRMSNPFNNIINNNTNNNDNNNMISNKLVFNNEEEIIDFIKRKYNKRNVGDIFSRNEYGNNNVVDEIKNSGGKYSRMSTEEGNLIKLRNEELSSEITQLKNDNKKYKKELNDMKTKFNDLSKQINTIKDNRK